MNRKCDKCDRPAKVHVTEIIGGKKLEKHLCEACAAKDGEPVHTQLTVSQLLDEFVLQTQQASTVGDVTCDHCGMTFLEFRQSELLGCPNDYEAFAPALVPLLERHHEGSSQHVGKVPARAGGDERKQSQLLRLRAGLKESVLREEYERAARIRDEIKELERP